MKIKKNTLYGIGTIFIVIFGIILFTLSSSGEQTKQIVYDGNTQIVKLTVNNGQYILEPSSVKKGDQIRIEADISDMPGCSKSIRIPAFGISKTFTQNDNSLIFTPDKAGTFNIACSMNMYKGTLTVLENDGTKSNYVEQKLTGGGSCGAGGGCGCGGG